jgi:hypothetical protein
MKHRILVLLCAGVFMTVGAAPALGDTPDPDRGPAQLPEQVGDFPEQPPGEPLPACAAITTNPGTNPIGEFDQHVPTFVNNETSALVVDACVPED